MAAAICCLSSFFFTGSVVGQQVVSRESIVVCSISIVTDTPLPTARLGERMFGSKKMMVAKMVGGQLTTSGQRRFIQPHLLDVLGHGRVHKTA